MLIAIIGAGKVGQSLAEAWTRAGHEILWADDRPGKGKLGIQDAVDQAEAVLLAVPFPEVEGVLKGRRFEGKVLIDATNPVGPGMRHALGSVRSAAELVQGLVPDARVVKAFNTYGYENFVRPPRDGSGRPPVMLVAGDDAQAKALASTLVAQVGFEPLDAGPVAMALHLEHMALLWIHLVYVQGKDPHFAWALVRDGVSPYPTV